MKKIGIIGFGNMGSAIVDGLMKDKGLYDISISEVVPEKIKLAADKYRIKNYENKAELIGLSDIVIIVVKPQELEQLFKEVRDAAKDKQVISICAGKKIEYFRKNLLTPMITRFMPNLAAMESKAAVGVAFGDKVTDAFKADCLKIAAAIGTPFELPESLMPAITGLSGSGIAFVFAFIHALALGGVAAGISYPKSLEIANKTIEGALAVLGKSKIHPVDMLSKVISPAGTTIKGVEALEKGNFSYTVMDAVTGAAQRAAELEG